MNMSTSKGSSGCESSWTMYLDQLSDSTDQYSQDIVHQKYDQAGTGSDNDQEDDQDLSMVSDASSGPPHLHQEKYCALSEDRNNKDKKHENNQAKQRGTAEKQHCLCLDDTASSPILHNFSPQDDNVDPPSENPATKCQGESQPNYKPMKLFESDSSKGIPGKCLGKKRQ